MSSGLFTVSLQLQCLQILPVYWLGYIVHLYGYQTTRPADNLDRDKSARKRGQVGP